MIIDKSLLYVTSYNNAKQVLNQLLSILELCLYNGYYMLWYMLSHTLKYAVFYGVIYVIPFAQVIYIFGIIMQLSLIDLNPGRDTQKVMLNGNYGNHTVLCNRVINNSRNEVLAPLL